MRGYPKHIATKQDFLNLLADPIYRNRTGARLQQIAALNDDTVTRTVSGSEETGDIVTEEIPNPMPQWKRYGFSCRAEIADIIAD